jgi:hypothetical protein
VETDAKEHMLERWFQEMKALLFSGDEQGLWILLSWAKVNIITDLE